MTAETIKSLADKIPSDLTSDHLSPPSVRLNGSKTLRFPVDPELGTFVHLYKNPAFGWHAAAVFASLNKSFPVPLLDEDKWVFKAYLYCKNPSLYKDKHIMEAIILAHPDMKNNADVIEAMLLSKDFADPKKIGLILGIPEETVSAYEKLFFNVLDRKKDNLYIRNIVYPDSRLIEMFDGYAAREDFGSLMKRYGYNYQGNELLYLAGLPNFALDNVPAHVSSSQLEGVLMSQGLFLTQLGFTNQTQNTQAIYHARSIMAAAKQGGNEETSEHMPMSTVGERLYETFRESGRARATKMIENRRSNLWNKEKSVTVETVPA